MIYLPESYDERDGNASSKMLFNQRDQGTYDVDHAKGTPPTAPSPPTKPGIMAKLTTAMSPLTTKLFNPSSHASHSKARSILMGDLPTHDYSEYEAEHAYYNPVVRAEVPRLWYVRDDLGISGREVQDTREVVGHGIHVTDEWAEFDAKGKVVWVEGGRERLMDMPVWEKRIEY